MILQYVESGIPSVLVLKIDYRGQHGRPQKKVEIYIIFEVFALGGRRTKADFKDQDKRSPSGPLNGTQVVPK